MEGAGKNPKVSGGAPDTRTARRRTVDWPTGQGIYEEGGNGITDRKLRAKTKEETHLGARLIGREKKGGHGR